MRAGFRGAARRGFDHVLQIDADGQHDAADLPRFAALAEAHPDAVICGTPVYDESVPKGRLYGRYLTHVWVWINTLSFAIRDSMCGFRVYPLAPVLALIDAVEIGRRMDFDVEILVRLHWRGAGHGGQVPGPGRFRAVPADAPRRLRRPRRRRGSGGPAARRRPPAASASRAPCALPPCAG